MKFLTNEENAHWYTADGESRHDADLRVARRENLFPSATSVLKIKAKPALETWKLNQAILASLTLPRRAGEDGEAYAARIVKDFQEQSGAAAELGTKVHAFAEDICNGDDAIPVREVEDSCLELQKWIYANLGDGQSEESIVNLELGYAGRKDWSGFLKDGRYAFIDFKTQNVKKKDPVFYDEWAWQLAAYSKANNSIMIPEGYVIHYPKSVCVSVVISTNPNNQGIWVKYWDQLDIEMGWDIFKCLLKVWQLERGYRPKVQ